MKIKDICTSVTDGSHNPPQGIDNSEYMMLSSKNVFDDKITFDEPRFLSEEDFKKEHKRTKVSVGDVLLTIVGTVGRTAVVDEDMPLFVLQRSVAVLHPKTDVCLPRFLMYALRGKRTFIENRAKGVAQKGIYLKDVSDIDVQVPDISTQEMIINLLDKVDTIVKFRKEELLALDNLIKARFVELFGDLANPKCQWKKEKLVDACKNPDDIKCGPFGTQLSKDEYCSSGVAVWEISQINSGFATQPTHFLTDEKANQLEVYSIKSGDIAMSRKGNVGRCAVFPETMEDGIIHSDILRIRVNNDLVLPVFMMYQLHYSRAVQHQIELVSSGAIMAGINVTKLKQIEVHIPPLKLQQQFDAFVAEVDKSKVAIQAALDKSQLLFDSLMQKYFG